MSRRATAAGLAVLVVSFFAWRLARPRPAETAPDVVVLHDRSESTTDGCPAVAALVGEAFKAPGMNAASTVLVLATGDEGSVGEPVEIGQIAAGVGGRHAMGGRRGVERKQQEAVAALVERCAALPRTTTSPLLLDVSRGLEHLRARGCGTRKSGCQLLAQTDLAETADRRLVRALDGSDRSAAALAGTLDNTGITVSVCGVAETRGPADVTRTRHRRLADQAARAARTPRVWLPLFTHPELVTVAPHCPKPDGEPMAAHATSAR